MSRSKRRTNLVRSSYLDGDDFARDLHAGATGGLLCIRRGSLFPYAGPSEIPDPGA